MNRKEATKRFSAITNKAEKYNSTPGNDKRFYPISAGARGRLSTIGLYDYKTKKHVVCDILSWQLEDSIKDMEKMVSFKN